MVKPDTTEEDFDIIDDAPAVDEAQASYDDVTDPDYDAGADPDYGDDFRDPDAEEGSQEWRARPQK
jgi:hypothetical protein